MAREVYRAQVDLLVRALRVVARESNFVLKGGTAINLFYRDMPRLSVDIDLTWLPVEERRETLANIDAVLWRLQGSLEAELRGVQVRVAEQGDDKRLLVRQGNAEIKIETSPVMRGTVHEPQLLRLVPRAEEEFGFAEMKVVAFPDLYAGESECKLPGTYRRVVIKTKVHSMGFSEATAVDSGISPHDEFASRACDVPVQMKAGIASRQG